MRYGEIYRINTPKGAYIGQALGWATGRWSQHLRLLRAGNHHNALLQKSYDEFGVRSLDFTVLETGVEEGELSEREYEHNIKHDNCFSALPRKVVTEKKRAIIWELIKSGRAYRKIAEEHGVALGTVSNIKQTHATMYNDKHYNHPIAYEQVERAAKP